MCKHIYCLPIRNFVIFEDLRGYYYPTTRKCLKSQQIRVVKIEYNNSECQNYRKLFVQRMINVQDTDFLIDIQTLWPQ